MRAIIITPGSSRKLQDDCHHEQKDSHQALLLSRQHARIDLDLSIKLCADNAQSRENTPPPRHRPHSMSSSDDGFRGGDCASDDPRCSPGASRVPLLLPREALGSPGADWLPPGTDWLPPGTSSGCGGCGGAGFCFLLFFFPPVLPDCACDGAGS